MDSSARKKTYQRFFLLSVALFVTLTITSIASPVHWRHLSSVTGDLPVPNGGAEQTAALVLDVDRDGLNDFVITERSQSPSVVWYRRSLSGWSKYVIENTSQNIEAGGAYHDIDGDGDLDIVFGGDWRSNQLWWWENPYPNYSPAVAWTRRLVKNSGATYHHDEMFGDFDGDGRAELVFWNQSARALMIAEIPANPRGTQPWNFTPIFSHASDPTTYEGLASADVDQDGVADIIAAGRWFKHVSGTTFAVETIDDSQKFSRVAAGQLKDGGRPEIVFCTGDAVGPITYHEWSGSSWTRRDLLGSNVDHGHSLQVGDIDQDGHSDVFSAEMRLDGANPNAKMRILYGDGQGNFVLQEMSTGIGNHESRLADLDGDGDLDILGKPYNWNTPRVDIWLNEGSGNHPTPLNSWRYIQADRTRAPSVFGNGTFGLDFADLNGDGYQDIASGHYFYRNPGGDMSTTPWPRVTLPINPVTSHSVDASLFFDAEGNGVKDDIIAEDLPYVLWLKANDTQGISWTATTIGQVPATPYGNSRTVKLAHVIPTNTKPDILLSGGDGTYLMQIPSNLSGTWPLMKITASNNGEQKAIGAGDINRDGYDDVAVAIGAERLEVDWWKNPGNGSSNWTRYVVGNTNAQVKMIEATDVNGDGRLDVIVTEEARPASVYWFEAPLDPTTGSWTRHTVATGLDEIDSMTDPDMNNDGQPDIVVGEIFGAKRVIIYENVNGGASWNTHVIDSLHESHNGARGIDLNNDGAKDIVSVAYFDYGKMHVWKNDSIPSVPLPSTPALENPEDNSSNLPRTPVLKWRHAAGATSFRIQVATDSAFADMQVNTNCTDTTLSIPRLASATTFFWRTRGINSAGEGAWSGIWRFTTLGAPQSPALISPMNGVVNQPTSVMLTWFHSVEADSYRVQVSTDSLFDNLVMDEQCVDSVKTVSGLANSLCYYWRVNAMNVAGTSAWSPAWHFTTLVALPASPVLESPLYDSTGVSISPTFSWSSSSGAATYRLQVSLDSLYTNIVRDDSALTSLSLSIDSLDFSTEYFWHVGAKNPGGISPYSDTWCFTTILATPILAAPENGSVAVPTSATLAWDSVAHASLYHVQVATDSLFEMIKVDSSFIATLSCTVDSLVNSTKYYWRTQALNDEGVGEWSEVWDFETTLRSPDPPVLVSPGHLASISSDTVQVSWHQSEPHVLRYWFELDKDSSFAHAEIDTSLVDTMKLVFHREDKKSYWWRVRARNVSGWGVFSETRSFSTIVTGVNERYGVPCEFGLAQNYPNPFNPSTQISFGLPEKSNVSLNVYDVLGRKVAELVNGSKEAGYHSAVWNASGFASGVYFARFNATDVQGNVKLSKVSKLLLTK